MVFLWKGLLIGIMFGVPVGTVGTMTIQKTMSHGTKAGIFTGLGSSTADCLYASIGALGLNIVMDFLLQYEAWINIMGGIFLLIMGIRVFRKNDQIDIQEKEFSYLKSYVSAFVIGITNPVVILTFLFAFSFFKIPTPLNIVAGVSLVLGVLLGTLFWWILLSICVDCIRKKGVIEHFRYKNKVFGGLYILFSIIIFSRLIVIG